MSDSVKAPDFIITATAQWDGSHSSPAFSLAQEFSKKHRVFFIDYPITLSDVIKKFRSKMVQSRLGALIFRTGTFKDLNEFSPNLVAVTVPVVLPINWLPQGSKIYRFFLNWNDRIFFGAMRKAIKKYKIEDFIYINSYNPFYGRKLPSNVKPRMYIYQSIDDIAESFYVAKHGVELEREAILNADLSIATGTELTKLLSKDRKVHLLPNAFDNSIFVTDKELERPEELRGINSKIIGYTGNIFVRIDYDLLYSIATRYKDMTLLMVGPRGDKGKHEYDFDALPNVVFTGSKDIRDLPRYLKYIDCAIIPFKCNKLTKSIYPLKINEYLSMGKPVITTNFSEDISGFRDHVYLSNTHEEFIENIERSLEEDSEELHQARIKSASNNTWKARVEQLWELINNADR